MDSGVLARDWLQCTSIGLSVPTRITTRNIISTDWHFAFASIDIVRRARNFEFSRHDIRNVLYELCYALSRFMSAKFTASRDNIIEL